MKLAAVVLAAGASQRMGEPKPLVEWRGRPFVRHVVDALRDGGCDPVLVVEGAHALPEAAIAPARRVVHAGWADGPFSSLQAGLRATGPGAVLVATVDRPHLRAATIRALLDAHADDRDAVWQPEHGGTRGHPVLLPRAVRDEVLAATPGTTLRDVLERTAAPRRNVVVDDPAVLDNIDTPADLARLALLPANLS